MALTKRNGRKCAHCNNQALEIQEPDVEATPHEAAGFRHAQLVQKAYSPLGMPETSRPQPALGLINYTIELFSPWLRCL
jgi:hypothetical protein